MARTRNVAKTSPSFSLRKLLRWPIRIVGGFILFSFVIVALYRFVPPPVTLTMLFDKSGITKDWMSLSDMDPDMAHAAIAAEDLDTARRDALAFPHGRPARGRALGEGRHDLPGLHRLQPVRDRRGLTVYGPSRRRLPGAAPPTMPCEGEDR